MVVLIYFRWQLGFYERRKERLHLSCEREIFGKKALETQKTRGIRKLRCTKDFSIEPRIKDMGYTSNLMIEYTTPVLHSILVNLIGARKSTW